MADGRGNHGGMAPTLVDDGDGRTEIAFEARLVAAGAVRTRLNGRGETVISAAAIETAVQQGQFEGLACFVDHAAGGPSLRDLIGVWHDVRYDAATRAAVGTFSAYDNAETRPVLARLERLLADAAVGRPVPDVGVSLVFYPEWAGRGRLVAGFRQIESADLVFFPAADGRLLARKAAARPSQLRQKGETWVMSERMRLVAAEDAADRATETMDGAETAGLQAQAQAADELLRQMKIGRAHV